MRFTSFVALLFFLGLSSSLALGRHGSGVSPRFEINTVMGDPAFSMERNLLVLSLRAILDLDPSDPRSFYQIGGIHGMPALPYMGVSNKTSPYDNVTASLRWMGYCEHSSNLFPAWHRPYVLALESSVSSMAKEIASKYPGVLRRAAETAAESLRWPYW